MTKKDYVVIAKVLNDLHADFANGGSDEVSLSLIVDQLANALEDQNPRFNRETFFRACGISPKFTERMFTPDGKFL